METGFNCRALVVGIALVAAAACGGGGGGGNNTPTSPDPPPPTGGTGGTGGTNQGTTITITSAGVNPKALTIAPGTRVTFVNQDARQHEMNSDPHPTHGDCPEIDQVGFLASGQSKQTGNMNTVRTCGYHDHNDPFTPALQGTITVR